jgi:hypothetical protein
MRIQRGDRGNRIETRALPRLAFLMAVMAGLASCNPPVGVAPDLRGTYWAHALVTNPNGGGAQVVRWGPPENRVYQHD